MLVRRVLCTITLALVFLAIDQVLMRGALSLGTRGVTSSSLADAQGRTTQSDAGLARIAAKSRSRSAFGCESRRQPPSKREEEIWN